jgi:hypothetical protein
MVCWSIWAAVRLTLLPADMLKLIDVLQMQGYRVVADPTWNPDIRVRRCRARRSDRAPGA